MQTKNLDFSFLFSKEECKKVIEIWKPGDQANLPSPSLATSCIIFLLNAGDWDSVTRLSHANMPHIVAARNSATAAVFQLARNLAFLMHNLRGNNLPIVKKFGKDVWDALSHLCSSAAGKRGKEGGGLAARERALVSSFLGRSNQSFQHKQQVLFTACK